ncbi:hypothetical protein BDU57DRAFT_432610, partial [Ampelomyces quisqualis]
ENVYNMDENKVKLMMPTSVKFPAGSSNKCNHRGKRVKKTTVSAAECTSADSKSLNPMIF